MATLGNNEEMDIIEGLYAFKATGALDIQVQLYNEGFADVTDGSFAAAETGVIQLPRGQLKVVNAGANEFIFSTTKVDG